MKTRSTLHIIVAGIAIAVVIAYAWLVSRNDFLQKFPVTVGSFNNIQYYKIDPKTIRSALGRNENLLFQLESDSSVEKIENAPLSWSQADYDNISSKIHAYVWGESLDSWSLYRVILTTDCYDNPKGFDSADYVYFREITLNGKKLYTARDIFITPQYGDITLGSDTNFPRPFLGWKYIQTNDIKVPAEQALQLAEDRGGKAARLSMQNLCRIYVSINPNGYGHKDWKVSYSGNDPATEFEVVIPSDK